MGAYIISETRHCTGSTQLHIIPYLDLEHHGESSKVSHLRVIQPLWKASATVSESVPIETAHEDMIVSRENNYQSTG